LITKPSAATIAISLMPAFVGILLFAGPFPNAYSEALMLSGDKQQQVKVIEATGHFANNQIENGSVTWIEGGLWHLEIFNSTTNINSANADKNSINAAKADFTANFTMVKPDGSLSHEHSIKNFASNNVIIAGGDVIIPGIGDIYTNSVLKYKHIPIMVHLMGKHHVLGVTIDTNKTGRHFASSNEMFGTLIRGTGIQTVEKSEQNNNNNTMSMNGMSMTHS
jgi:Tfp pilus assembly major pilin PilA